MPPKLSDSLLIFNVAPLLTTALPLVISKAVVSPFWLLTLIVVVPSNTLKLLTLNKAPEREREALNEVELALYPTSLLLKLLTPLKLAFTALERIRLVSVVEVTFLNVTAFLAALTAERLLKSKIPFAPVEPIVTLSKVIFQLLFSIGVVLV